MEHRRGSGSRQQRLTRAHGRRCRCRYVIRSVQVTRTSVLGPLIVSLLGVLLVKLLRLLQCNYNDTTIIETVCDMVVAQVEAQGAGSSAGRMLTAATPWQNSARRRH